LDLGDSDQSPSEADARAFVSGVFNFDFHGC
jgi:hypothetical protein